MTSFRGRSLAAALKFSRHFRTNLTPQNVAAKRVSYAKLERYFPLDPSVTIEPQHGPGFVAEWLSVPGSRPDRIMLYMHGGGFVFNSTRVHRDLISRFAAAGQVTVLSLDYSLAPEHPYPAALNETLAAYNWLLAQGHSPNHIVLAGDSAGASLVLSGLLALRRDGVPLPAGAVAIAPATDATLTHPASHVNRHSDPAIQWENLSFFIEAYFGKTPFDDPIASPLHGDLRGLPPLLIHAARNELMYADADRFVAKAQAAGVPVKFYVADDLWHVWHLFARYLPEARAAVANVGQFLHKVLPANRS